MRGMSHRNSCGEDRYPTLPNLVDECSDRDQSDPICHFGHQEDARVLTSSMSLRLQASNIFKSGKIKTPSGAMDGPFGSQFPYRTKSQQSGNNSLEVMWNDCTWRARLTCKLLDGRISKFFTEKHLTDPCAWSFVLLFFRRRGWNQ